MSTVMTNVTIQNGLGLHARPAMAVVDLANSFESDIHIGKADQKVDAKSIMQVMMLAAAQGTELTITAQGLDAQQAIDKLEALFERKFR